MKHALRFWVLLNGEKILVLMYEIRGEKKEEGEEDGSRSTAMEVADKASAHILITL